MGLNRVVKSILGNNKVRETTTNEPSNNFLTSKKRVFIIGKDEFFVYAAKMACHHKKISPRSLRRELPIGYSRAVKIIDQLEEAGIVSSGKFADERDTLKTLDQILPLIETLEEKRQKKLLEEQKLEQIKQESEHQKQKAECPEIIQKYHNYIDKFCEIAEREVSTLDEWGDENWEIFDKLKKECIIRIAKKIYQDDYLNYAKEKDVKGWFDDPRG